MIFKKRDLSYFSVQFFAVLMGISGFSIVYAKAYHILNFSSIWYLILLTVKRMFSGSVDGDVMESVVKDIENVMSFLHFRYSIF